MDDDLKRRKSLNIDGTKYYTHFTKKFESRKTWIKPNEKELKSVIPGKVLKMFVKDGQKVSEGQELFILEAMKMHNRILSPFDGTIKKVYVDEGLKVPKDQLIIEFK